MNSRAALRTSSFSVSALSSAVPPEWDWDEGAVGGKENERLGGLGKGLATVGVGPQSVAGRMSAGRNARRALRCGAKRVGVDEHNGVNEERNFARLEGEDWRVGRVDSIG
jgi:hypothetical protein